MNTSYEEMQEGLKELLTLNVDCMYKSYPLKVLHQYYVSLLLPLTHILEPIAPNKQMLSIAHYKIVILGIIYILTSY